MGYTELYTTTADSDIKRMNREGRITSILKDSMVGREYMLNSEEFVHFPSFDISSHLLHQKPPEYVHYQPSSDAGLREVIVSTAAAT